MKLFEKTLIPLDGSDLAERILPAAHWFARAFHGEVHLLHIIEPGVSGTVHSDRHLTTESEANDYLHRVASALRDVPVKYHVHTPLEGGLPDSIAEHATEEGTDTIAMTTHGSGGVSRILLGTMAERTLSRSRMPMLVAPVHLVCPLRQYACTHILAPVDLETAHDAGVEIAMELAAWTGARLTFVGVAQEPGTLDTRREVWSRLSPGASAVMLEIEASELQAKLDARKQEAERRGIRVEAHLLSGEVETELRHSITSTSADLVVLTTHMHHGLEARWQTSLTSALAGSARTHLLLIPASGA